ncbi:kinase-like protein [Neocallimastix californiae]|uniref:non-specific serine/threonine protein kinase n=1 Tax=Neocallimastix californiae TaxID=1754190 RepID=A0A1Y2AMX6_9FUNG|nr:kinase-like protein [Neocallimastix californiae]|eukprot:ORY23862.1 kinase-like protein [Neocallimastix californiae]
MVNAYNGRKDEQRTDGDNRQKDRHSELTTGDFITSLNTDHYNTREYDSKESENKTKIIDTINLDSDDTTTPTIEVSKEINSEVIKKEDDDDDETDNNKEEEVSERIKEEIKSLLEDIPELKNKYYISNKTGEGTFSSVYKALRIDEEKKRKDDIKKKRENKFYSKKITNKKYYALKRIYATSSPQRIENEISILHDLRKKSNIVSIYSCVRYEDQVILVLPYIQHNDFRDYLPTMTMNDIRYYMISILTALKHCHELYIMHRDIKPSNFLYDIKNKSGVLVDFGLAQRMDGEAITAYNAARKTISTNTCNKRSLEESNDNINSESHSYIKNDVRPPIRANRAGTRGFRAPEVLFKCVHQTVAIDIWSVGVILLSMFTQRFPFFNSNDDYEALLELGCIFGKQRMKYVAYILERTYETNIPSIDQFVPFQKLCQNLNPKKVIPKEGIEFLSCLLTLDPKARITAKEALEHPFLKNFDEEENINLINEDKT